MLNQRYFIFKSREIVSFVFDFNLKKTIGIKPEEFFRLTWMIWSENEFNEWKNLEKKAEIRWIV